MGIHTLGGVNYHTIHRIHVDPAVTPRGWYARWELPTRNGGPTEVQMHGDWLGPYHGEMPALEASREDFVGSAAEPVNTEFVNDR